MKVVINNCFGGYGLSYEACMKYAELKGFKLFAFVEKRGDDSKSDSFIIFYSTEPLINGKYKRNTFWNDDDIKRDDPILVKVVEILGDKANGRYASLKIVNIPKGTDYTIEEYDGNEHIAEKHQTWS